MRASPWPTSPRSSSPEIHHVLCSGLAGLGEAIGGYLAGLSEAPDHAAIAVAAPVTSDDIALTNSPWSFARRELCRSVGLNDVLVLNDFEALALSLPHLAVAELHQIGGAAPQEHATKIVLAASHPRSRPRFRADRSARPSSRKAA